MGSRVLNPWRDNVTEWKVELWQNSRSPRLIQEMGSFVSIRQNWFWLDDKTEEEEEEEKEEKEEKEEVIHSWRDVGQHNNSSEDPS